jgi:diguanylate cyclase (GGDEF)-like protein
MRITHHDLSKTIDVTTFVADLDRTAGDRPLAVAVGDLDGFGALNDRAGHAAGDAVLGAFEHMLRANLPRDAVVARVSGDEYGVGLPGASAESALIQLEEIRAHFASGPAAPGVDGALDASFGVASRPPHADSTADVVRAANEALMRAKREGGGRVVIYVEEKMTMKSNYYSRASLDRLAKLSRATSRTEASLLREALDDLMQKHRDEL